MEKIKTPEEERRERIKEYAEALEYFIQNPEALKNDILKAYVDMMIERIEKASSEKQKHLTVLE